MNEYPEWLNKLAYKLEVDVTNLLEKQANTAESISDEGKLDADVGVVEMAQPIYEAFSREELTLLYLLTSYTVATLQEELDNTKSIIRLLGVDERNGTDIAE